MYALERVLRASVITDHFIVPQAYIQEVSLRLGRLQALDYSWVHQVTAQLKVDDRVVDFRLAAV